MMLTEMTTVKEAYLPKKNQEQGMVVKSQASTVLMKPTYLWLLGGLGDGL